MIMGVPPIAFPVTAQVAVNLSQVVMELALSTARRGGAVEDVLEGVVEELGGDMLVELVGDVLEELGGDMLVELGGDELVEVERDVLVEHSQLDRLNPAPGHWPVSTTNELDCVVCSASESKVSESRKQA